MIGIPPIRYSSSPPFRRIRRSPYNFAASPHRKDLDEAVTLCVWFHLYFVMRIDFSTSSICLVRRVSTPFDAVASSDFLREITAFFLASSSLAFPTFTRNSSACAMICWVLSAVSSFSACNLLISARSAAALCECVSPPFGCDSSSVVISRSRTSFSTRTRAFCIRGS